MRKLITLTLFFFLLLLPTTFYAADIFEGLDQIILANGMTVLVMPDNSKPLVTVQLWVKAGIANENTDNNGISNLVAHMLFKRTSTRPLDSIQQEIDARGGVLKCVTGKDYTYCSLTVPSAFWLNAITILADVSQNASFNQDELNIEKQTILQQISSQNDSPQDNLWTSFYGNIFKQSPYRLPVMGTTYSLGSLTREMVQNYYKTYYRPDFMTMVVVGNFDPEEMSKSIKTVFPKKRDLPPSLQQAVTTATETDDTTVPLIVYLPGQTELTYHLIGFNASGIDNNDIYALEVASAILGQGLFNRLNQSLYEDKQLVYDIRCGFNKHKANSVFYIDAVYQPSKISEVVTNVLSEINKLTTDEFTEAEVSRARAILKTNFMLQNQTTEEKAYTLGFYASLARVEYASFYLPAMDKVQKSDIKRVVQKYLSGKYTSVLLTPNTDNR